MPEREQLKGVTSQEIRDGAGAAVFTHLVMEKEDTPLVNFCFHNWWAVLSAWLRFVVRHLNCVVVGLTSLST